MPRDRLVPFEDDVIDRLARMEAHLETSTGQTADHETRLRSVEQRQWLLAGAAAVLGTVANHVAGLFPWK
jgi:hypothetical protein